MSRSIFEVIGPTEARCVPVDNVSHRRIHASLVSLLHSREAAANSHKITSRPKSASKPFGTFLLWPFKNSLRQRGRQTFEPFYHLGSVKH